MGKKVLKILGVAIIVALAIFIIWCGYKVDELIGTWFLLVAMYILAIYLWQQYHNYRKKHDKE